MRRLEALNRPIPLAALMDSILEQFDRYLLLGRIKLDPISPVARGETDSDATRANPTPAAEAALIKFITSNSAPRVVDRFLDLMEMQLAATNRGVKRAGLAKLTAIQYFGGVDRDLAELCVGRR